MSNIDVLIKYVLSEFNNTSHLFEKNGVYYLTKFFDGEFVTKKSVCKSDLSWEWEK
jgi:hypothetical protein